MECDKPSGRFRVVFRPLSVAAGQAPPTGVNSPPPQHPTPISIGAPTAPAVSGISAEANGGATATAPEQRRYGGAIVRLSELGVNVMAPFAVPPKAQRPPVRSVSEKPSDTVLWDAVPIDTEASGKSNNVTSFSPTVAESHVAEGEWRSRRSTQPSNNRGRGSKKAGKKPVSRTTRHRGNKGSSKGVKLPLQRNGMPFPHSWSTVRGRRQLHYNGRTYRGVQAHRLWDEIKAMSSVDVPAPVARPSTGVRRETAVRGGSRSSVTKDANEQALLSFEAPKPPCETPPKRHRRSVPKSPRPLTTTVVQGRRLLLDDDEDWTAPKPSTGDVVLLSDSGDGIGCDSESSTLTTWPSLLIDDEGSSGYEYVSSNSTTSSDSCVVAEERFGRPGRGNTHQCCNPAASQVTSPNLAEHDGFLYPAEVLAEVRRKGQNGIRSLKSHHETSKAVAPAVSLASDGVEVMSRVAERPNGVRGFTFIGTLNGHTVAPATGASASAMPSASHVGEYRERYEEMDVFPCVPDAGEEDLFVVGEEIGGMRFAA
ncbi:uncharacterized protein TEOVI_000126700 [Trypanosoma equiperdum]|uniref:Uncharacterized protein n=1 Tax=Trypanosoma equiperdum TaxID=5694 RepID=A0A1G4ICF5_TRYEQ|nr:hypothetical protein, conserved [Trypanosoma equiperdum]